MHNSLYIFILKYQATKQCDFSKELAICILLSKLATVNVEGNMMIMKMGVVTDLINYWNNCLAISHWCLYRPCLELLRPGTRWVPATRGAEAAIKHSLTLPFSCFCTFFSSFFSLLVVWFSSIPSFLKHKTACVIRRFGRQSLLLYFPPWLEVLGHCW